MRTQRIPEKYKNESRGERRLRIAGTLMKLKPNNDVLSAIKAMPKEQRDYLRGLVDWVDDYENHEFPA